MFFLPLYDDNPTRRKPFITWALIILCGMVFFWQFSLDDDYEHVIALAFGFVPARFFGSVGLDKAIDFIPAWMSLGSYAFLHGGWLHFLGNMLYLWIFGNNVEDAMGRGRFVVFYLLCGAAAALVQGFIDPKSTIPMIGASGAIAGISGAYLLLYPRANVVVLMVIIIYFRRINVPAVVVLLVWFAAQLLSAIGSPTGGGGVAFWAHVGGFVAGLVLIPFFKSPEVPFFSKSQTKPLETMPLSLGKRQGSVPRSGNWPSSGSVWRRHD
jgi:membrane associated rhomboid family serine protease